jgi:hypothetical protein
MKVHKMTVEYPFSRSNSLHDADFPGKEDPLDPLSKLFTVCELIREKMGQFWKNSEG